MFKTFGLLDDTEIGRYAVEFASAILMTTDRSQVGRKSGAAAEHLADFLMLAQRSCFLDISKDLTAGKISYAQLFLLGSLEPAKAMTMSEIARKMGHSTAAATGLVDRLQKLGYVDRMHAEDDRRKILVAVTEKGRKFVKHTREGLASSLAKMLADMDRPDGRILPDGARQVMNAVH